MPIPRFTTLPAALDGNFCQPARRPVTVCHGVGIAQNRHLSASAAPRWCVVLPATTRRAREMRPGAKLRDHRKCLTGRITPFLLAEQYVPILPVVDRRLDVGALGYVGAGRHQPGVGKLVILGAREAPGPARRLPGA